jgi:hypothetical protein
VVKRLLVLVSVAGALLAASAAPSSAAAPCWKVLLNDWLDGRIDKLYAVSCYRQAVNHLPTDIETYSSAREDILRALQARIAGKAAPPNSDNGNSSGGTPGGSGSPPSGGDPTDGGPVGKALGAGRPDSVDAVPLPLIVLSAIAGLLLALGAAGLIARRMQMRRPQIRPAESPSPPRNS